MSSSIRVASFAVLLALPMVACGDDSSGGSTADSATLDAADSETSEDTTPVETTLEDTTPPDSVPPDTAVEETTPDTGPDDTTPPDTAVDTAVDDTAADTGPLDIGQPEGTSAQIQALIDLAGQISEPVVIDLLVEGATVTMAKPPLGNDAPGFFIQGEAAGPAIFVAHMGTAPIGRHDLVTLRATELSVVAGVATISTFTDLTLEAAAVNADALLQDVSSVDLTDYASLQSEYVTLTVQVESRFEGAGQGYRSAQITTEAVTAASDDVKLRLPAALVDSLALSRGCLVEITRGVIWRFLNSAGTFSQVQPSAFSADDLFAVCDGPRLQGAAAASATSVVLTFDKPVDPGSVNAAGDQFTIDDDLTVSAAIVAGNTILLTTSSQEPGATYVVSIAESVTDAAGRPVITSPEAGTFEGFAGLDELVINEVDYDQPGDDVGEFIEIFNPGTLPVDLGSYRLELVNGGNADDPRIDTIALSGTIPANGYAVVAAGAVTVPEGAVVVRFSAAQNNIQNGPRDGVRVTTLDGAIVLDALLYETPADTAGAILGYAEGTPFSGFENNEEPNKSIGRCANGADTDDNSADFTLLDTPTPGASNACP